jgi:tRNA-Thr(GGU) m(6)t(6)A37 methyltransferase TsaA
VPDDTAFRCVPIGFFRSDVRGKVEAPRQSGLLPDNRGRVEFEAEYQRAIADLVGFEFVWLITWLDRAEGWRPLIHPPRSRAKKSLFATRSPHRPNPIGLSSVRLVSIDALVMHVRGHDLIDGTPILDVKPYLPYTDAHPGAGMGWVEEADKEQYEVEWTDHAREQADWLSERGADLSGRCPGVAPATGAESPGAGTVGDRGFRRLRVCPSLVANRLLPQRPDSASGDQRRTYRLLGGRSARGRRESVGGCSSPSRVWRAFLAVTSLKVFSYNVLRHGVAGVRI